MGRRAHRQDVQTVVTGSGRAQAATGGPAPCDVSPAPPPGCSPAADGGRRVSRTARIAAAAAANGPAREPATRGLGSQHTAAAGPSSTIVGITPGIVIVTPSSSVGVAPSAASPAAAADAPCAALPSQLARAPRGVRGAPQAAPLVAAYK